jgi:hypothetical protein
LQRRFEFPSAQEEGRNGGEGREGAEEEEERGGRRGGVETVEKREQTRTKLGMRGAATGEGRRRTMKEEA